MERREEDGDALYRRDILSVNRSSSAGGGKEFPISAFLSSAASDVVRARRNFHRAVRRLFRAGTPDRQTGSPAGMQSGARAEEYDPHHLLFSAVCRPARDSGIDFLRVLAQYMERAPAAFSRHGETESGTGGFFPKIIPQCCLLRRCKVYWRNRRRFLL